MAVESARGAATHWYINDGKIKRGGNGFPSSPVDGMVVVYEDGSEFRRINGVWAEWFSIGESPVAYVKRKSGLYNDVFNADQKIYNFGEIMKNNDPVNHPSHYTRFKGIEVIQLTEQLNFCRGNAVKYIARAGAKDDSKEIEDLEKARWYIDREIERLKGEK